MIIFKHSAELNIDMKQAQTKWLKALKIDQTNADIFYSLALYYFL
jgi:Tfp pilus assembly protein PilF